MDAPPIHLSAQASSNLSVLKTLSARTETQGADLRLLAGACERWAALLVRFAGETKDGNKPLIK
jgi:hypothetical protein